MKLLSTKEMKEIFGGGKYRLIAKIIELLSMIADMLGL